MIIFRKSPESGLPHCIFLDDEGLRKEIVVHDRGTNTLSPPDPELIKLLDDMKEVK